MHLSSAAAKPLTYLTQRAAQAVDVELMSAAGGFSIDQLMELAGLSVAQAAVRVFPQPGPVLVCCGPGNNGGDGLVAARHLVHFGYSPTVYYPKVSSKPLFVGLVRQLENLGVPFTGEPPLKVAFEAALARSDFVIDALFGFSFSGPIRAPFDTAIEAINASGKPVLSVDIPSGWDVERGQVDAGQGIRSPHALISLTAPKQGVIGYTGIHYVGGRFVPPALAHRFGLVLPAYPGTDQVVRIA
ncbi:hypothetical protein H9P43_004164 [Blastocladiella emersonii ATCC 22665]|nr:hypothetical protein H9P43_004164 [Blastocladiella emersonii ATCC 22665]